MSALLGRRVLVIGQGLACVAREALAEAVLEFDGCERLGAGERGRAEPDLVLIDSAAAPPAALAAAIEALGRRRAPPPAILVGEGLPAGAVRALLRLSRSDVLEAPFDNADLARAAADLLAGAPATAAPVHSRCWSVMSAVGGAGATTLAIELAEALVRAGKGKARALLVDLNLADGAASAYLGAPANLALAQASAAPDRIDASLLEMFCAKVSDQFDLLAAPRDPRAFERTAPHTVLRLLEVACQTYDWVIVDVPRQRQAWTTDVLWGSDEIIVASELTVPALLAARALTGEIEAELPNGPAPRVVLNRLAPRMFGPAPSLAEAERALGRKADGAITSDWEAAAASVNLGGSISRHRPRSRIVRDIEALARTLAAGGPRMHVGRAA